MDPQDSSSLPSNSPAPKRRQRRRRRRRRTLPDDDDVDGSGESAAPACTGKSCQSCTAGAIADCVAVCCCPCAVVNFFTLTFLKLPWAVARRCLGSGGRKNRRREALPAGNRREEDPDGISKKGRAGDGTSEIALSSGEERNDNFVPEFKVEEVWLEVGHMGFGRVSFTGSVPLHSKAN